MRMTVSTSVKPVLLGGGGTAFKVAVCLFCRYALRSHLFSQKKFLALSPLLASRHALPSTANDRFVIMDLERIPTEYGESTYLLIPCTPECASLVSRNRTRLESRFIIRSPREIFEKRELFPLRTHHRKDL